MRFIFLFLLTTVAFANPRLEPFQSDACSSWPEGPRSDPNRWRDCCFSHDIAYWMGGTREDRKAADEALRTCVNIKDDSHMGDVMYLGVRVGGKPTYDTSYRWGYGWPDRKDYKKLNFIEKKLIIEELDRTCFIPQLETLIQTYRRTHKLKSPHENLRRLYLDLYHQQFESRHVLEQRPYPF